MFEASNTKVSSFYGKALCKVVDMKQSIAVRNCYCIKDQIIAARTPPSELLLGHLV